MIDKVRLEGLTNELHLVDARALLTPEVKAQIILAVQEALREEAYHANNRQRDLQLDRRATELD